MMVVSHSAKIGEEANLFIFVIRVFAQISAWSDMRITLGLDHPHLSWYAVMSAASGSAGIPVTIASSRACRVVSTQAATMLSFSTAKHLITAPPVNCHLRTFGRAFSRQNSPLYPWLRDIQHVSISFSTASFRPKNSSEVALRNSSAAEVFMTMHTHLQTSTRQAAAHWADQTESRPLLSAATPLILQRSLICVASSSSITLHCTIWSQRFHSVERQSQDALPFDVVTHSLSMDVDAEVGEDFSKTMVRRRRATPCLLFSLTISMLGIG